MSKRQPRDYQQTMLCELLTAVADGQDPVGVAPTGAGKTMIISMLVDALVNQLNMSVLIAAHRKELVQQAHESLAEQGLSSGLIIPGQPLDFSQPCQIGMVQTVSKRLGRVPTAQVLIIDETHHAVPTSQTYQKLVDYHKATNAARGVIAPVIGLTATPERLDGTGLGRAVGGFFDVLVQGPSVSSLIQRGHLVPAHVYSCPPPQAAIAALHTVGGDYNSRESGAMMNTPTMIGEVVANYRKHAAGEQALAFCVNLTHARALAAAFRTHGIAADCISGDMPVRDREAVIGALKARTLQVLVSCEVIGEGVNVPDVSCVILARPTKSRALHLQQCGRGLRPAPGKSRLIVLDHAGNTQRLGFVDDPITWDINRAKSQSPAAPLTRECFNCGALNPIREPACRVCGEVFPVAKPKAIAAPPQAQQLVRVTKFPLVWKSGRTTTSLTARLPGGRKVVISRRRNNDQMFQATVFAPNNGGAESWPASGRSLQTVRAEVDKLHQTGKL